MNYPFLTQKERDTETGLDYFSARYYSATQGRFTSPDEFSGGPDEYYDFKDLAAENPTFYADLTDPQSLNKYQYGYNNPLLYIDPDGHQGVREWFRNAANKAADFADGVGRGISSSLTFGASGAPRSDDSLTNRAGQGVGTVVTAVAGYAMFNAGGGVTVLSGGSAAEVSVPVAVGGVVTVAGATVNAVRIAATPIQRNSTSQRGSSSEQPQPKEGSQGGPGSGKNFPESTKSAERTASNNSCRFCGVQTTRSAKPTPRRSNIDHAIPKSRGGNNTAANAQNTCQTCNLKKGTKTTKEFLNQ